MRIETKKGISKDEWAYLTQWRERVFPEEGRGKEWSQVSWHTIAYAADGSPAGHIGFDGFFVHAISNDRPVVGIGGVVVRPEYQGQGIPALLFQEVHEQGERVVESNVFTLFCPGRLVSYYEKHGYRLHSDGVRFLQHGQRVESTFNFMVRGGAVEKGVIELQTAPW